MTYKRLCELPTNHSFFLFGPRGTGKSTLLEEWKSTALTTSSILHLDLLDPATEERYAMNPSLLGEELEASSVRWCVIDEVQKVPSLLDIAHSMIQKKKIHFALTGSSARKLKRGRANLLAGRAFDLKLHPMTYFELGKDFNLAETLRYGSLPGLLELETPKDKIRFLESYTRTYLKEEIQLEQIVRNVQRFRRFLAFAGQMNTKILSFSKLSAASGVDEKSVGRYFEILEDTLVGLILEPYDKSIRKRQKQRPKFYLFDTGIACQLREDLAGNLRTSSSLFGEIFEQWFILECHRLRDYRENGDQFYFLQTKDDSEIDLIIERKGQSPLLIEIKSAEVVTDDHLRHLRAFKKIAKHSRAMVVTRESRPRITSDGIEILPYGHALKDLYS